MGSLRNIFLLCSLALTCVSAIIAMSLAAANRAGTGHIQTSDFQGGMGLTGSIMTLCSAGYGLVGLLAFNDIHLPSFVITGGIGSWFLAANSGIYIYWHWLSSDIFSLAEQAAAELAFSIIASASMMISVALCIGARARTEYERLHDDDGGHHHHHHSEHSRLTAAPVHDHVSMTTTKLAILSLSSMLGVLNIVLLGLSAANYSGATDVAWPVPPSGSPTEIVHTPSVLSGLSIAGACIGILVSIVTLLINFLKVEHPALKPMWADGAFVCIWLLAAAAGIFGEQLWTESQSFYSSSLFAIHGQTDLMIEYSFQIVNSIAWLFGVVFMSF